MFNATIPGDLADLIDSIVAHKEKMKKENKQYDDNMERLYIYDYIDTYYKDEDDENQEEYKIEIQM